jgi:tRNA threonylcarbamoyladenosine biosynthesis protein TsaE
LAEGGRQATVQDQITIETRSEAETRALGAQLGAAAQPGDVFILQGGFGAGKTTLVQGMARGLGVEGHVTSPSFVIANEYEGRLPIYHLDLYRIEVMDSTTLEAISEYFGAEGVCAVEWPASLPAELIPHATQIDLTVTGDESRRIQVATPEARLREVFARAAVAR